MNAIEVGSPEWVAARRRGIGASELAACCRCGDYKSAYEMWAIKTGRVEPEFSREQTRAMQIGSYMERSLLEDWCEDNCAEVVDYQKTLPIPCEGVEIWATVESIVQMPDGDLRVVEIKTTGSRNKQLGEEETDQLPADWLFQAQGELEAADLEVCTFIVMNRDSCAVSEYHVTRNRQHMAAILKRCQQFWQYVDSETTPPAEWARIGEQLDRFRWIKDGDKAIDLTDKSPQAIRDWERYEQAGRLIRRLEKRREQLKASVVVAMGDHKRAIIGDGRELVIQEIVKQPYVVNPKPYCQLVARKVK